MAIDSNKFVINKGMNNEFIITIKQNNSTLPMVIEGTDTFIAKLYNLETKELVLVVTGDATDNGQVTVHDAANGQILIVLNNTTANELVSERGDKIDRYYLKPTYRLAIDCDTVNNGNFVAKIAEVYVEE